MTGASPAESTQGTLAHYEGRSDLFWEGTKDHDVTQNINALLDAISGPAPYHILDFGCGPGRDVKQLKDMGHTPVGLDGCRAFCKMAAVHSGCPIWEQNFVDLDLPGDTFDGIFANASLFHIPKSDYERVLGDLYNALKPGGVLFSSNPRGDGEAIYDGNRYGYFMEIDTYRAHLAATGFSYLHHYYRPTNAPKSEQNWLAVVARRPLLPPDLIE